MRIGKYQPRNQLLGPAKPFITDLARDTKLLADHHHRTILNHSLMPARDEGNLFYEQT